VLLLEVESAKIFNVERNFGEIDGGRSLDVCLVCDKDHIDVASVKALQPRLSLHDQDDTSSSFPDHLKRLPVDSIRHPGLIGPNAFCFSLFAAFEHVCPCQLESSLLWHEQSNHSE